MPLEQGYVHPTAFDHLQHQTAEYCSLMGDVCFCYLPRDKWDKMVQIGIFIRVRCKCFNQFCPSKHASVDIVQI